MRVYINYATLSKNANDYLNYSSELQEIIDNLKVRENNIKNLWNSANTAAFCNLVDNFVSDLQVDTNLMKRYGNLVLGIKDNFKDNDLKYAKHLDTRNGIAKVDEDGNNGKV